MADDQDQSQKTEEPSQKKLEEAHKKGDVVKSRDVAHWFVLLAVLMAVMISADTTAARLSNTFVSFLDRPHAIPVEAGQGEQLLRHLGYVVGSALLLPMVLLVGGALAGHLVQHRPVLSGERLKPDITKLSPVKGLKRLFGAANWMEFGKTFAKFIIVGGVVAALILPEASRLDQMMSQGVEDILPLVRHLAIRMLGGVLAIMALLAGLDYLFQYMQRQKKLRMSKQELKDEYKQTEGDPHVKSRLRQIRAERSRTRMMAAVPDATVVITNPTHFAVALKYERDDMDAPKVVAKGVDHLALRIRELAKEHKVPIVENPPLARTLYAAVDVDQEIPGEHYKAVAEVISFVLRLRQQAGAARH